MKVHIKKRGKKERTAQKNAGVYDYSIHLFLGIFFFVFLERGGERKKKKKEKEEEVREG